MAVTIYDVAYKAGVGIGTVSRALNNSPNISPETKKRILTIASDLDYQPHAVARNLARKKNNTIASVVPFFFNYFYIGLLRSLQHRLSSHNYDLFLYSVDRFDNKAHIFDKVLSERKSDGVLIISLSIDDEYALKFRSVGVPVMMVDGYHSLLDSISIANERGAISATRHIIQLGHKNIGMINGDINSYPAITRFNGFSRAIESSGLSVNARSVIYCDASSGEHGFNEEGGYRAMNQLLALGKNRPTAVFVASDVQALGALRAAKEAGLKIPHDLAIIGFDDIDFAKYVGLTTMRQPVDLMAELAVDRLLKRIEKQASGSFQVELDAELIQRESCGGLASFQAAGD